MASQDLSPTITGATPIEALPAIDWNGKLHVVNGSPLSKPYPRDRMFWIITDDALAVEVAYSDEHMLWTRRETYCRQDGEAGSWEPGEIMGWTDSYEDAQEVAALLALMGDPITGDGSGAALPAIHGPVWAPDASRFQSAQARSAYYSGYSDGFHSVRFGAGHNAPGIAYREGFHEGRAALTSQASGEGE